MSTLFLVATPIGNLDDITLRALRVLSEVSLIAAEDTRAAAVLLRRHGLDTPTTSYFEHNKLTKLDRILAALADGDVALISEAGTPALSDPGYELVRAALAAGHEVTPIPGPSAALAALTASGLPTDQFSFVGFLPRRAGQRQKALQRLSSEPRTLIFYEAPHRLLACLHDLRIQLGDRQCAVARELTKLHEQFVRGNFDEVITHFEQHEPRGECTVVVAPATEPPQADGLTLSEALKAARAAGLGSREAVAQAMVATGLSRRTVYAAWLRLQPGEQREPPAPD